MYRIDQEKCKKTGYCVEACPIAAIKMSDEGAFCVADECTDCGACEAACDNEAVERLRP